MSGDTSATDADLPRKDDPRPDLLRAEAARKAGRPHEADGIARDVLERHPGSAEAMAVRAFVAAARGDRNAAVALLDTALAGRNEPNWLTLRGQLHRQGFRLEAALADLRAALERLTGPARLQPLIELARIQVDRDDIAAASEAFLAALAVDPDNAQAHLGLGQVLLSSGEYASGWLEYEWRNKLPEAQGLTPTIKGAAWNGMTLPRGRLLVICDQGFGDAIQFSRFLPPAASRVRELVLACGPELADPLGGVAGVAQVWHRWSDIPAFTAWTRLSTLPFLLGVDETAIGSGERYLAADPGRVATWSQRLQHAERERAAPRRRGRIGFYWSGRTTHPNNARRSLPFARLQPVLDAAEGHLLVSLQKMFDPGDQDLLAASNVLDMSASLETFADTAALLCNLDLVVSVDSAVAHLAGALGRPVGILLPRPADWRWLRGRDRSPWYPTVRLFRQQRPGEWSAALDDAAQWVRAFEVERTVA